MNRRVEKLELNRDAKSVAFTISEIVQLIDARNNTKMVAKENVEVPDSTLSFLEDSIR